MAALRLGDPRAHALLSVLCLFRLLPHGFTSRDLREHLAPLLGKDSLPAGDADPGQAFVKAVLGLGVRATRRDAARCASATAPGAVTSRVS